MRRRRSRGDARPPEERLAEALGVAVDPDLLHLALTHRSWAYEHGGVPTNERLEFLGDSVLGLIVTDALYTRHPDQPEGQLAKLRASVVNMRALADVARGIGAGEGRTARPAVADAGLDDEGPDEVEGLGAWLLLGRGEEATGGRDKQSILADTLEAVIGATYLSGGLQAARRLVLDLVGPVLDGELARGRGRDHKTVLQELAAGRLLGVPDYAVDEDGPDHAKTFRAQVLVGGELLGDGVGNSKKEAEQLAAEQAVEVLEARKDPVRQE